MAITAPTTTGEFSGFLNPNQAAPIFERAARESAVMRLVRKVPLGINGESIPVVTGRMQAGWVAEGARKPASNAAIGLKTITPKKLAAIAVVSAEVVRANPGGYMDVLRPQIAEAFALAFDLAALYDKGPDGTAGGGPFDTWLAQTTKRVEIGSGTTVHNDLVAALRLLVNDGKRLTGFALDDRVEPTILDAVDTNNRPIYVNTMTEEVTEGVRSGRLLGRPSFMAEGIGEETPAGLSTAYTVGFAGDWRQAAWGAVGGISFDVSTEATVTINGALVSLWENNLMAIRAEAEYGFLVNEPAAFVELGETTPAA